MLRLASIRAFLVWALCALAYAGLCAEVWDDLLLLDDPWDFVDFFGLSYEQNLPTWYSASLLLACSLALAAIAHATRRAGGSDVAHWWGLAAAFAYISLDEVATIHEELGDFFDYGGVLYYGWIIPAAIVVALFGLAYLGFLRRLPAFYRARFVAAGALYVFGALGMELPLGYWTDLYGRSNFGYALIDWVEETLEIAGASLFLDSLLLYLAGSAGEFRVQLLRSSDSPAVAGEPEARPRLLALLAFWGAGLATCAVIFWSGWSEVHHYEDDAGNYRDRPDYQGEHLGEYVRGGEPFLYRGSHRVFDRQPELRALACMALVGGIGAFSVRLWRGPRRRGEVE